MSRKPSYLALSASAWIAFNAVVVVTVAFLADVVLPRTVDSAARIATGPAVAVDLVLLLLFAVQHSTMARTTFKDRLRRHVPAALERTTYVLATDAVLALLLVAWQPFGGEVWHVDGPVAVALWALCGAGWALAIASTYAVDHVELTGLRQAGWLPLRPPVVADGLVVGGLHAVVRHPLMTGLLVAFWATPRMGAAHLLFAAVMTLYIAVGVVFEERDLRRRFGAAYDAYAARVPAVLPRLLPGSMSRTGRRLRPPRGRRHRGAADTGGADAEVPAGHDVRAGG